MMVTMVKLGYPLWRQNDMSIDLVDSEDSVGSNGSKGDNGKIFQFDAR